MQTTEVKSRILSLVPSIVLELTECTLTAMHKPTGRTVMAYEGSHLDMTAMFHLLSLHYSPDDRVNLFNLAQRKLADDVLACFGRVAIALA
jgi:hypothetical protein